jgi:hypothetical protein
MKTPIVFNYAEINRLMPGPRDAQVEQLKSCVSRRCDCSGIGACRVRRCSHCGYPVREDGKTFGLAVIEAVHGSPFPAYAVECATCGRVAE